MKSKRIHYLSGVIITLFVGLHLVNHAVSICGANSHIEMMNTLRVVYRNLFIETLLLIAVFVQIISGLKLFKESRKKILYKFEKLQIWSGLYLALFFVVHVGAVFVGRFFLHLDTNFYFGVAGLNVFPFNVFFIPYYALAIISFFAHIASIHCQKMKQNVAGVSPKAQASAILVFGIMLTLVVFYGLTNHFHGVEIPAQYNVLVGK